MIRKVPSSALAAVLVTGLAVAVCSPTRAAETLKAKATGRPATIEMIVPADAQISFNGEATTQTGTHRVFETPALAPDHQYHYRKVRVSGTVNGRKFEETICICVREGDHIKLAYPNFLAESQAIPAVDRKNTYIFGPDYGGRTIFYRSDYGPPTPPSVEWPSAWTGN